MKNLPPGGNDLYSSLVIVDRLLNDRTSSAEVWHLKNFKNYICNIIALLPQPALLPFVGRNNKASKMYIDSLILTHTYTRTHNYTY